MSTLTLGYADPSIAKDDLKEFNLDGMKEIGVCPSGAPMVNIKFTGSPENLKSLFLAYCEGAGMTDAEIESEFSELLK